MSDLHDLVPPSTTLPSVRDPASSGIPPRKRRHVLRWVVLVVSLLFVGLLATVADGYFQALHASRQLRELVPSLQGAREDLLNNPQAATRLQEAEAKLADLQSSVDGARFTFGWTGALPFVGRPVKAVELGTDAATEAIAGLRLGSDIARDVTGGGLLHDGTVDVTLLRSLEPRIAQIMAHLGAARADLVAIPPIPFLGQLTRLKAQAIAEIDDGLASGRRIMSGASLRT